MCLFRQIGAGRGADDMKGKETVQTKESFFKRKNIEISVKRYLQDALSAMALGLFGSLLIGVIFDTIGVQTANLFGDNVISSFFVEFESSSTCSVYQCGDRYDGSEYAGIRY